MLYGDGWVYVHIPKCAGTFAERWLELNKLGRPLNPGYPSNHWKHLGVADIPPEHLVGRVVIAPIRNPWDWWVSWFHFTRGHTSRAENRSFHKRYSKGTNGEFKSVLRRALFPENYLDLEHLDRWPHPEADPMPIDGVRARLGIGLFSFQFLRLTIPDLRPLATFDRRDFATRYDDLASPIVFDCSEIRTGLLDALESAGVTITEHHRTNVENLVAVNAAKTDTARSERQRPTGPPSRYYDDESLAWIADREWFLVDRYGYTGPSR